MKNYFFLATFIFVIFLVGCPISAPKQPVTFKKIDGRQNDFLAKFDSELAEYDCLMSGRNWSTTATSDSSEIQQQLAPLRNRRTEILRGIDKTRVDLADALKVYQDALKDILVKRQTAESNLLMAQKRDSLETLKRAYLQRQEQLIDRQKKFQSTTKTFQNLQAQIDQLTHQNNDLDTDLQKFTDKRTPEIFELEIEQLDLEKQLRLDQYNEKVTQINAVRAELDGEAAQNQTDQNTLLARLHPPVVPPPPDPNNPQSYGFCSGGANTLPDSNQKTQARIVRDNLLDQLIRFTDLQYYQFENDLYVKRASASLLADAVDLSGNLGATIINGARVKTIINASLIAFRGGRKSASLNFFQDQTADVLITNMQTARNLVLNDILTQKKKSVDEYSLDAALGDVIRYFYAGTLPRALQQLKQDSSRKAADAEAAVREIKNPRFGQVATKEQVVLSGNADQILTDLTNDLKTDDKKSDALKNLQAIADKIKTDKAITDAAAKDAKLAPLVQALTDQKDDGEKLIDAIDDLRFFLSPGDLADQVDNDIINANKVFKGGK